MISRIYMELKSMMEINKHMKDLKKLSKKKLEELGRDYGVELDRRLTKSALIERLEEVITEEPSSMVDLKAEYVEEVIQPVVKETQSFRSLREAKAYAKANGGKVVEKGKFYVR